MHAYQLTHSSWQWLPVVFCCLVSGVGVFDFVVLFMFVTQWTDHDVNGVRAQQLLCGDVGGKRLLRVGGGVDEVEHELQRPAQNVAPAATVQVRQVLIVPVAT